MDRFNEQLRAFIDLIGKQLTGTRPIGKAKHPPPKRKTKVPSINRSGSKSSVASSGGKTSASSLRIGQTSNTRVRADHSKVEPTKRCPDGMDKSANVFAPRLLHLAGTAMTMDEPDAEANWISIKTLAEKQMHCAVYLIHCVQHNKVAVTKPSAHQAMWMPFMPIPADRPWQDAGLAGLLIALSDANMELFISLKNQPPFTEKLLLEVMDIQMPHSMDIVTRFTWYVPIDTRVTKNPRFKCCQESDSIQWIDVKDINEQSAATIRYLWGNELLEKVAAVQAAYQCAETPHTDHEEYSLAMAFKYEPQQPQADPEQQILSSAKLTEKDIERLYDDFLAHCFPSLAMTLHSFKTYMTKYGMAYTDERLSGYFRAFNFNKNGAITFSELLMGLACIDTLSIHNETRAKFIIRYYDALKSGYLSEDDLRLMIQHMNGDQELAEEAMEAKLNQMHKDAEGDVDPVTAKKRIHRRNFLVGIGKHKIRGTARLCRIGKPICALISKASFERAMRRKSKLSHQLSNAVEQQYNGTCVGCRAKRPVLDDAVTKLTADGCFEEQIKAQQISAPSAVATQSKPKVDSRSRERKPSKKKEKKTDSLQTISSVGSSISNESTIPIVVDKEAVAVAHRLYKLIHEFAPNKGNTRNPAGLLANSHEERKSLLEKVQVMERAINPIIMKHRWVPVSSPAIIIGDIHGNLADLLTLEKSLWKRFPLAGPSLVFLGDIVDRGRWSVECAVYVFCLILMAPSKCTLLRGNHEVRELQCHYTYRAECVNKYGDELGQRLWELTNRIFDRLPLCAVIDGAVFCAHGGIPRSASSLNEIAAMPKEIANPVGQSEIAWEILWSDPLMEPQFVDLASMLGIDLAQCDGFIDNKKRGTAWFFNEQALSRFLAANNLTQLVRGHEVPPQGFTFHFGKKCATVFSCSHYCGNNNLAAVILVDRNTMRAIRIDTTSNESATD